MLGNTVVFLALLVADLAFAVSPREVTWGGVAQFNGKTVELVLPDAVLVSGKLERVEPQALFVKVRSSADNVKYPNGQLARVAREDVRTFAVQRTSKHWRIVGTAVGFLVGGGIAVVIELSGGLFAPANAGRDAAAMAAWGGCTAGGFFLGRSADRRAFIVVVRPGD